MPSAGSETRHHPQVHHAISVIEQHFANTRLSVRAVAQDLGISTEHLCRVLKRHTGRTFVALVRVERVRAARQLLRTTTLSIKQIADRVGFSSASRFDESFKKICGVSPTEFRHRSLASAPASTSDVNSRQGISTPRKP